jgi:BirA family biotin operon repressor/biotin-[acetyl-CoA-carboxylase] ligase
MHLPPSVIWYASVDSTNTCLLRKFESECAAVATGGNAPFWSAAIAAQTQTAGRGQRQNHWQDVPGESLLLSIAAPPAHALEGQALFSFSIAVTLAEALEQHCPGLEIELKWPNDLLAGGRKLGGILIENVLRGANWQLTVVGVGINLLQPHFAPDLAGAVSLLQLTGRRYNAEALATHLGAAIFEAVTHPPPGNILQRYNARLFRQGAFQDFVTAGKVWTGRIEGAEADGRLRVRNVSNGELQDCVHGVDVWVSSTR